ncbi:PH domain-containing protein [Nocardioides bruguierae]|uniref:PH domain-containing protein n=1 Tax=Nocardioides bruguierae TaxID=2945102 RepID=A0A9X2D8J9_9ACTN|nr:PH domain-containing protein [Nocardioides bruguierae]MCM0621315.1 PH domain-containing protein [Nocardioides bruguierae]
MSTDPASAPTPPPPSGSTEPSTGSSGGYVLREPAHRLHRRAVLAWYLGEAGAAVLGAAVVLVAAWLLPDRFVPDWLPWALIALDVAAAAVVPPWRYRVHRWEVTDTAVYTQTGWWTRERRIAPLSRVQTVDLEQGLVDRLLGLAEVRVTTASAAGALRIPALDRATAERLAQDLTRAAEAIGGDGT